MLDSNSGRVSSSNTVHSVHLRTHFGSNDEIENEFERSIAKRFNIDLNGQANWFLQTRIHQCEDFSISTDQHRCTKVMLKKHCPDNAPFGTPQHRSAPAPPTCVCSKENRPSDEEAKQLTEEHKGLDFRSAVCSLTLFSPRN